MSDQVATGGQGDESRGQGADVEATLADPAGFAEQGSTVTGATDDVDVELPRCDTVVKATGALPPALAPFGKAGERFYEMLHGLTGEKVAAEMLAGDCVQLGVVGARC